MSDRDDVEPFDQADCIPCKGTGTVSVIIGDEQTTERCIDCGGTGRELSRDGWLRLEASCENENMGDETVARPEAA